MKQIKREKNKLCFKFHISGFKNTGFIFLEIIIAIALISIVFITLLSIGFSAINLSASIQKKSQADSLIKEELEAVRAFRDGTTWSNFRSVNFGSPNNYYFTQSSGQWIRNSGSETVGIFTRSVVFDQAYRDASGNIASSGTLDTNTTKVTATVAWQGTAFQVVYYVTNWQNK